jgi:hypothetical protein
MNNLMFCVSNDSQFIHDEPCPKNNLHLRNYWNAASRHFARKARGEVLVVLNGTRSIGAVVNTSTFSLYELPEFNSPNINKVQVLLLHRPNQRKYETCSSGASIRTLQQILEARNISFECTDDPKSLWFYMCFDDPQAKECKSSVSKISSPFVLFSLSIGAFLVTFIF